MRKSKYETHVLPNLEKIAQWVEAGADLKEIAEKLHVAYSTLRLYLDKANNADERFSALSAAFARARVTPDKQVCAALFKRACGYRCVEVVEEEKLDHFGNKHTLRKTVTRDIPPDPTSIMFWLANRDREHWAYRPESEAQPSEDGGVVVLSPVMERCDKGGQDE